MGVLSEPKSERGDPRLPRRPRQINKRKRKKEKRDISFTNCKHRESVTIVY